MEEVISVPFDEGELEERQGIYRTYKMDFDRKRICGMIDGKEAAAQAVRKALQTRRYAHLIYDDQYGCDIFNKIGNSDLTDEYFDSDIPAMIEDALLPEDMVTGIGEVAFTVMDRDSVEVSFCIQTIFGEEGIEEVLLYD